jgi:hypothetical protein
METMTRRALLASFLFVTFFAICAYAQPGRWEYLGEANVDGGQDHDRIRVNNRSPYRAIQIQVERAAVTFDRVIVHFGNGQSAPIQLANTIRAGSKTRVIDLPGDRRYIDNVEFYYRKGNWQNTSKPKVRLFGMM